MLKQRTQQLPRKRVRLSERGLKQMRGAAQLGQQAAGAAASISSPPRQTRLGRALEPSRAACRACCRSQRWWPCVWTGPCRQSSPPDCSGLADPPAGCPSSRQSGPRAACAGTPALHTQIDALMELPCNGNEVFSAIFSRSSVFTFKVDNAPHVQVLQPCKRTAHVLKAWRG